MGRTAPRAKRPQETHFQWRSRVIALDQMERDRDEPVVTPEAARHGDYEDAFVTHVETGTIARAPRNRQVSSLALLHDKGQLTSEQYSAALQIARVAETIERSVSVRCASLEARVDNSGSAHDPLLESLTVARLQVAYRRWRERLPMPRRMIVDMVIADRSLVATARVYGVPWRKARARLVDALDQWGETCARVWKEVGRDELYASYRRIGVAA